MITQYITHCEVKNKKLVFDKKTTTTFFLYNGDLNEPLQKFWFLLENVKLLTLKNSICCFGLSKKQYHFCEYMQDLENKIRDKYLKKIETCILEDENKIVNIQLTDDTCIFDEMNHETNTLLVDSSYNIILELEKVCYFDGRLWFHWCLLQCKKNQTINLKKSMFLELEKTTQIQKPIPSSLSIPPPIPSIPPQIKKTDFMFAPKLEITSDLLKSVMLRKTVPEKLTEYGKEENLFLQQKQELKRVETKESSPIRNYFKDTSYYEEKIQEMESIIHDTYSFLPKLHDILHISMREETCIE